MGGRCFEPIATVDVVGSASEIGERLPYAIEEFDPGAALVGAESSGDHGGYMLAVGPAHESLDVVADIAAVTVAATVCKAAKVGRRELAASEPST